MPNQSSDSAWRDESSRFSVLFEHGRAIASVENNAGDWRYLIEQSVIPHRAPSTRTTISGYASKIAAQIAAEDHIERARTFRKTDAAALGREAIAADPEPDNDDEFRLRTFDVLRHRGIWL
jgi:hypothetical protein